MGRSSLSRRRFVAGAAAGLGALFLGPARLLSLLGGSGGRALASGSPTKKSLVFVYASGGLRGPDFCDASGESASGANYSGVETSWTSSGVTYGTFSNGSIWLPPAARPIWDGVDPHLNRTVRSGTPTDWTSRMAVVHNMSMESASHLTGQLISLTGYNRQDKGAGPLVAANTSSSLDAASAAVASWNMGVSLPQGPFDPSLLGEPDDLYALFGDDQYADYTGPNRSVTDLVLGAVDARNAARAEAVAKRSRFHDWRARYEDANALVEAGLASTIEVDAALLAEFTDPAGSEAGYDDTVARRFAGAYKAITEGFSRAVTVTADGFDTHDGNQFDQCCQLASLVAVLMDKLASHPSGDFMANTMIVVGSEFSRTAAFNGSGGTDHEFSGATCVFAGSGFSSFSPGAKGLDTGLAAPTAPDTDPTIRADLWATVMKHFDVPADVIDAYYPDADTSLF
jgi:hypothetical protein